MLYPLQVYAGTLSSLGEKVRAIFVREQVIESDETIATSQTMNVLKPVVVDSTTTANLEVSEANQEALQVVAGPLRLSTEDIDFPLNDAVSVYEVKKGDTLGDVAKLFEVSVNTIMWANNLTSKTISQGDVLVILPITGIKHTVKKGDSVATLAKKYKADQQDIAKYNGILADASLAIGETIIVPDGEIEVAAPPKPKAKTKIMKTYTAVAGFLARPLSGGRKTQGIHGNNAVDIAATPGTPIVAAAAGRAIVARMGGYNGGYGNMVIIAHDKGVQTVYAHMRDVYITQGQSVVQGQVIGEVGNSGRSSGPHLHFEVRGAKNPF